MSGQVQKQVSEPDCSFSTHFQLLSSDFIRLHLFLTIFTHLYWFSRFPLFSTVFTQIWELPLIFTFFYIIFDYFHSFSAIFDRYQSLFNILAHILSPLTITTHFQLPLLDFNHFQQFTVTLTHLNCFSSYIRKYELIYICYYLYFTNDTYFDFYNLFITYFYKYYWRFYWLLDLMMVEYFSMRVRAGPGPTLAQPDWPAESGPALRARVKGQKKWPWPSPTWPPHSVILSKFRHL